MSQREPSIVEVLFAKNDANAVTIAALKQALKESQEQLAAALQREEATEADAQDEGGWDANGSPVS